MSLADAPITYIYSRVNIQTLINITCLNTYMYHKIHRIKQYVNNFKDDLYNIDVEINKV